MSQIQPCIDEKQSNEEATTKMSEVKAPLNHNHDGDLTFPDGGLRAWGVVLGVSKQAVLKFD